MDLQDLDVHKCVGAAASNNERRHKINAKGRETQKREIKDLRDPYHLTFTPEVKTKTLLRNDGVGAFLVKPSKYL